MQHLKQFLGGREMFGMNMGGFQVNGFLKRGVKDFQP